MSFMGNYGQGRPCEISMERKVVRETVKRLFYRSDFPSEIFVALANSTVVNQGDVVWANLDNEHPYDFVPMARIDDLITNLPSKEQFLQKLGAAGIEEVSRETAAGFWDQFDFQFAESADGVTINWQ